MTPEKKAYHKAWGLKNKEKTTARLALAYANNREKIIAKRKKYYEENPEKKKENSLRSYKKRDKKDQNLYMREYNLKVKLRCFSLMGGVCKFCGYSDHRALQVDHIKGDGALDRGKVGPVYYLAVIKSIDINENKYQLLCANCNWIKRSENKELTKIKYL